MAVPVPPDGAARYVAHVREHALPALQVGHVWTLEELEEGVLRVPLRLGQP